MNHLLLCRKYETGNAVRTNGFSKVLCGEEEPRGETTTEIDIDQKKKEQRLKILISKPNQKDWFLLPKI